MNVWGKVGQGNEITWLSRHYRFWKPLFSKCFPATLKPKASVFKFLRFEKRFRKAPLKWRISVDSGPSRRNEAVFSHFSGVTYACGFRWYPGSEPGLQYRYSLDLRSFLVQYMYFLSFFRPSEQFCTEPNKINSSSFIGYFFYCCCFGENWNEGGHILQIYG